MFGLGSLTQDLGEKKMGSCSVNLLAGDGSAQTQTGFELGNTGLRTLAWSQAEGEASVSETLVIGRISCVAPSGLSDPNGAGACWNQVIGHHVNQLPLLTILCNNKPLFHLLLRAMILSSLLHSHHKTPHLRISNYLWPLLAPFR